MWYHRRKDISLFVLKKNKGAADFSLKSANLLESSLFKVFTFFFAVGLGLSWLIPQPAISQAKPKDVELTLVSFSVTKSAYERIIPRFVAKWKREVPNSGIVSKSVVALVARSGNPKKNQCWADLTKPGIKLITANPKTS